MSFTSVGGTAAASRQVRVVKEIVSFLSSSTKGITGETNVAAVAVETAAVAKLNKQRRDGCKHCGRASSRFCLCSALQRHDRSVHGRGCPCDSCTSSTQNHYTATDRMTWQRHVHLVSGPSSSMRFSSSSSSSSIDPLGDASRKKVEEELHELTKHEAIEKKSKWEAAAKAASSMAPDEDMSEQAQEGLHQHHSDKKVELNGPRGPEPTRFGDWEQQGRCSDF